MKFYSEMNSNSSDDPSTMSLETQMTHFPALAPENAADGRAEDVSSASTKCGRTNASRISLLFFRSFFRNDSANPIDNSAGDAAHGDETANDNAGPVESTQSTSAACTSDSDQRASTSNYEGESSAARKLEDLHVSVEANSASTMAAAHNANGANGIAPSNDSGADLKNYKHSEFRRYWMPDATGRECYECREKFNAFRRRHHCRLCGQIFCGRCSNRQINGAELGYFGVLRLCNYCATQVDSHVRQKRSGLAANSLSNSNVAHWPSASAAAATTTASKNAEIDSSTSAHFFEPIPLLPKAEGEFSVNGTALPAAPRTFLVHQHEKMASGDASTASSASSSPSDDFLAALFERNIEKLLDNLLQREHLDSAIWRDLLLKLSRQVIDLLIGRVLRSPNALNVLDFVHVKKLSTSAKRPFFELIHGVAFSKILAHTVMKRRMENVSLMLLSGNICYERVVEKLSSLEQIMLQEKEYLKTQVERVTSRRVSLLLVEHCVSRLAVDMLLAEGVGLVTNVKRRVLERIARATNSDVITSLDAQFLQPRVGFALSFEQRTFTSVEDRSKKSVLIFDQCSNGLSVLLHGSSMWELTAVKRILKFLLVTRYSSRLEAGFLQMFNSVPGPILPSMMNADETPANSHLEIKSNNIKNPTNCCDLCDFNRASEAWNDNEPSEFTRLMRASQLTNSPAIRFAPPYFETCAGRVSPILPYFRSPLFHFLSDEERVKLHERDERIRHEVMRIVGQCKEAIADNENLRHSMLEPDVTDPKVLVDSSRWARFRVHSSFLFRRRHELNRLYEAKKIADLNETLAKQRKEKTEKDEISSPDLLNPYNCQRIPFLYCANTKKVSWYAPNFCMGPYVLLRQFYVGHESGHKDTSLGVFLMNYCFDPEYKCGTCERTMLDHLRRIVHRNARIEIATHALPAKSSALGVGAGGSSAALANASASSGGGSADDLSGALSVDTLPSSIPNMSCSSVICWRRCLRCNANSCSVLLPDTVYHLSFAKFIDYLANGTYWVSGFPSSFGHGETCQHCTFHEHVHFFAYHNFVVSFRVFPIRPLHVTFNAMICRVEPEPDPVSSNSEPNNDVNSYEQNSTGADIELLMNGRDNSSVMIREIADGKSTTPDIGSIIAHTLASSEYEERKKQHAFGNVDVADNTYWEFHFGSETKTKYSVKVYFAEEFEALRAELFGDGEAAFIRSLSRAVSWRPQGGKSGANFFRTVDERFVIKQMLRLELDSFRKFGPSYFGYVNKAFEEQKLTALCKIYGVFGINVSGKTASSTLKMDVLVMEYLFYKKNVKQVWDLKGSLRNRYASTKTEAPVLLDENLVQDLWGNQLYVHYFSKVALNQAIINDSQFLSSHGIMDYSLLAGVCQDEVLIGIVDYVRTFTLDKKVESLVKNALPIAHTSTVLSPELYCRRFYDAIDGYFAVAPDQWTTTGLGAAGPESVRGLLRQQQQSDDKASQHRQQ